MAGRRGFLLGGMVGIGGLALGGCFDRSCHEANPGQKQFLDGLASLARPALGSANPLAIEEAPRRIPPSPRP